MRKSRRGACRKGWSSSSLSQEGGLRLLVRRGRGGCRGRAWASILDDHPGTHPPELCLMASRWRLRHLRQRCLPRMSPASTRTPQSASLSPCLTTCTRPSSPRASEKLSHVSATAPSSRVEQQTPLPRRWSPAQAADVRTWDHGTVPLGESESERCGVWGRQLGYQPRQARPFCDRCRLAPERAAFGTRNRNYAPGSPRWMHPPTCEGSWASDPWAASDVPDSTTVGRARSSRVFNLRSRAPMLRVGYRALVLAAMGDDWVTHQRPQLASVGLL